MLSSKIFLEQRPVFTRRPSPVGILGTHIFLLVIPSSLIFLLFTTCQLQHLADNLEKPRKFIKMIFLYIIFFFLNFFLFFATYNPLGCHLEWNIGQSPQAAPPPYQRKSRKTVHGTYVFRLVWFVNRLFFCFIFIDNQMASVYSPLPRIYAKNKKLRIK